MSLYNDSLVYATDTTATQLGDLSFGAKAGASVTGALVSGLGSIYNTGASILNGLGGSVEELDTTSVLNKIDTSWGDYYNENKQAIDAIGFIGTSLLPGTLAIKGLKAVQAGNGAGAFGRALRIPITQQASALSAATEELSAAGGTLFTRLNINKAKMLGWEVADQTLQAAAFEVGVALTMKQSPLLADDNWWDIGKGIMTGAALGGVIGGTIGGLVINKDFKTAIKTIDEQSMGYQAITGLKNLDITAGDKAYGLLEAVLKVPEEILDADKLLNLSFHVGGKAVTKEVDISRVLQDIKATSSKNSMLEFGLKLRELASGKSAATGGVNPEGSEALASFIIRRVAEQRTAGSSSEKILDDVGTYLYNLRKVTNATEDAIYSAEELHYFKKAMTPEEFGSIKTIDDLRDSTVSNIPFKENKYNKPYIWMGSTEEYADLANKTARIGEGSAVDGVFPNLKSAWAAGYHIAQQTDGTLHINTTAGKWRRVEDPVFDPRRFLNTRIGTISDTTVLTAADRNISAESMKIRANEVEYETKNGLKRIAMEVGDKWKAPVDVEEATARHAWASKLEDHQLPSTIDSTDISLLDRLAKVKDEEALANITIKYPDGVVSIAKEDLQATLFEIKSDIVQKAFLAGNQDIRELAYFVNADEKWVEKLVGSEFGSATRNNADLMEGLSRDLADYTRRENVVAHYDRPQQFTAVDLQVTKNFTWEQKRAAILEQAGVNGGQFVTGELAYAYRVQAATKAARNASISVMGTERISMLPELAQDAAKLANSLGSGSSFLGSANASYGETFKLAMQNIGKYTHLWATEDSDAVVKAMSTVGTNLINNKAAAAEVGIVTNVLRSESKAYYNIPGTQTLLLRDIAKLAPEKQAAAEAEMVAQGLRTRIEIKDPDAFKFLQQHQELNANYVEKQTVLAAGRGFTSSKDPNAWYAPPVDTNYFQHFSFVRGIDGKAFGTSEVAMIFGRDADELARRTAAVDKSKFEVITKDQTELYHKMKGDYQFDQTLNERNINSELHRTGALANFVPETNAKNIVEDYLKYHQNQANKLVRNAVETHYAQQVAELDALGKQYVEQAKSVFGGKTKTSISESINPYDDYKKTMLDISKRSEYTFFHQANEFVDALGTRAYNTFTDLTTKAKEGSISFVEAADTAERFGLKGMYSEQSLLLTNAPRDRNLIKEYVAKANMMLGNLVLRLDFVQPVMNVISTPLLLGTELASIRTLAARDPELAGAFSELTRVKIPGQEATVPSMWKLLGRSIEAWHGPEKLQLIERYSKNGDMKAERAFRYHEAVDNLAMRPDFKEFSGKVNDTVEKFAGFSNWAEDFTRFASANVMHQLTEPLVKAGKLDIQTQNSYISTFVNRVQGNYITSQRPIVFQGVTGSMMGLFQTYSFNLMQQLLRHVENKDHAAIATMFGLQAGLFGLNGLPMFDAINTHLIGNAAVNKGHYDAYSIAPSLLGKDVGDWLMYGTASAFPAFGDKWPSLYSRGDINPRHMTILPMVPTDIPAIDASIKFVTNLKDIGSKLVSGADVGETLLQGVEHNGINRPLAGIAQAMMGHSTTSKGSLISASNDLDVISTLARVAGAKPMDEAVALNNLYRLKAYQVADADRMSALGETVKTKLVANKDVSSEDLMRFQSDYAKIGGRVENFHQQIQRWSKDANQSVVEKLRTKLNSSEGQRLNEIMGATPLQDYRNSSTDVTNGAAQ